jgi:hypothetical protein
MDNSDNSYSMPDTDNIADLDPLIDKLRSYVGEANANLFLTVKFSIDELAFMLDDVNCNSIAFIPVFIYCEEKTQTLDPMVSIVADLYYETLSAFPLNNQDELLHANSIPVSTKSWPKPWPPYNL